MEADNGEASPVPALSLQTRRDAVRDEILHHMRCTRDLWTRLNSLTFISILPSELLIKIFLEVAQEHNDTELFGTRAQWKPYRWIRISHVCKHWRTVALGCPNLWSDRLTVTKQREWMVVLLERSKSAPLTISLNSRLLSVAPRTRSNAVQVVLSQLPRVRTLSITMEGNIVVEKDLFHQLGGPAPLLEMLIIKNESRSLAEHHHIDKLIRHDETRRLRRLDLHACKLDWREVSLPSLTDLVLTHGHIITDDLLIALAHMPLLRNLDLRDTLTLHDTMTSDQRTHTYAALPHLQYLNIEECVSKCAYLLDHLDAPSLARLCIDMLATSPLELSASASLTGFLAALAVKMHALGKFITLVVSSMAYTHTSAVYAYAKVIDSCALADTTMDVVAGLHPRPGVDSERPTASLVVRFPLYPNAFTTFFQLSSLGDVRCLIVVNDPLEEQSWLTIGQRMAKLTQLHIRSDFAHERTGNVLPLQMLYHHHDGTVIQDTDAPGYLGHYLFPRLRLIILDHLNFAFAGSRNHRYGFVDDRESDAHATSAEDPRVPSSGRASSLPIYVDRLLDCFIERYEAGVEIETLRLLRPVNLGTENINRLREVIRFLEWDGNLESYNEYDDYDSDHAYDYDSDHAYDYGGSYDSDDYDRRQQIF
ncbi:hypothetical protein DAEQUDRAFT_814645 [Daedalea quercina L-15889]|uniref:F-box domain-containing protein n=1 Tax=Daedalea quercina L-15889 TaxID=1314783 RepID=A0A165LWI7_9APHY|nr:hypothetical protein DAEQUDRAFT_814645 [Daedalea quercina L-15889]